MAKNTYGTGAFLLRNIGPQPTVSAHGLLTTVLWQLGPGGPVAYALEGSVFVAGAAVQWLRDGLQAIQRSADVEALAAGRLARGRRLPGARLHRPRRAVVGSRMHVVCSSG